MEHATYERELTERAVLLPVLIKTVYDIRFHAGTGPRWRGVVTTTLSPRNRCLLANHFLFQPKQGSAQNSHTVHLACNHGSELMANQWVALYMTTGSYCLNSLSLSTKIYSTITSESKGLYNKLHYSYSYPNPTIPGS
jgi:hypothetical protein